MNDEIDLMKYFYKKFNESPLNINVASPIHIILTKLKRNVQKLLTI